MEIFWILLALALVILCTGWAISLMINSIGIAGGLFHRVAAHGLAEVLGKDSLSLSATQWMLPTLGYVVAVVLLVLALKHLAPLLRKVVESIKNVLNNYGQVVVLTVNRTVQLAKDEPVLCTSAVLAVLAGLFGDLCREYLPFGSGFHKAVFGGVVGGAFLAASVQWKRKQRTSSVVLYLAVPLTSLVLIAFATIPAAPGEPSLTDPRPWMFIAIWVLLTVLVIIAAEIERLPQRSVSPSADSKTSEAERM